jgi:dTDP-4-dehydrorhamnose reductase
VLAERGMAVTATLRGDIARIGSPAGFFGKCALVGDVDVLDGERVEKVVGEVRPDWILNCVGIVKQLPQAQDRYHSVAVNSLLPHRLARAASRYGGRVLHFSTDCVFDGQHGGYNEDDPSDAQDVYGKSKFLGETDTSESTALTLRTSIIGHEIVAPKTALVEWLLSRPGPTVTGYAKAVFSGVTTAEMADLVHRLILDRCALAGTWHVAGPPISKYDLLKLIRDAYQLPLEIVRDEAFVCDRSLSMSRFAAEVGYTPPDWPTMVRRMAAERHLYS